MFVPNLVYQVQTFTPTPAESEEIANKIRSCFPSLFPTCETRLQSACRIASTPGEVEYVEFEPWLVRSESRPDCFYEVEKGFCSCPDHAAHGSKIVCKHRFAVHIFNELKTRRPSIIPVLSPVQVGDLVTFTIGTINGRIQVSAPVTAIDGSLIHVETPAKYNGFTHQLLHRKDVWNIERPEPAPILVEIPAPEYAEL